MNIALIGSGGREHAICQKLIESSLLTKVYCIPGNAGTSLIAKNLNFNFLNFKKLYAAIKFYKIELVVVGPEVPLVNGIVDFLQKNKIKVFGPNKDGAKLEFSKSWAKEFMQDANIPTANFWKVNSLEEAKKIINSSSIPLVVKADGLASGKGVFIPNSKDECFKAAESIFNGRFGNSGNVVVLEEKIQGPEVSVFALCDGKRYTLLPTAQDHKRLNEKDKGPNTGGMGAYSPAPLLTEDYLYRIIKEIIEPTINELNKRDIDYRGVIYFGLMITESGPKVIEYNCRFGDPECELIMPMYDGNIIDVFFEVAESRLNKNTVKWKNQKGVCVAVCSGGYPEKYQSGFEINGLEQIDNEVICFHSGTKISDDKLLTNGGRVLVLSTLGESIYYSREKVYKELKKVSFTNSFYRKDIALRAIENE